MQQFTQITGENRWASVARLFAEGWFEPVSDDDVFELYTLAQILDTLEADLGYSLQHFGLIRQNRSRIVELHKEGNPSRINVYFDQSPATALGISSRYSNIAQSYVSIKAASRRPDITLEKVDNSDRSVLLIEVKKTEDDAYQRDSIYKVFGYLYDFADLWQSDCLQALLIFPKYIEKTLDAPSTMELMCADDRDRLRTALSSF
jgi:hypothetical protein